MFETAWPTTLLPALLATATIVVAAAGPADASPDRIRGTISAVGDNTLTIASKTGGSVAVTTDQATKYAYVVPSSLDDIKKGDFIGTATKGPKNFMVALELVIFPASMRGAGEGQYGWDKLPDTTMRHATGSTTASSMTNGNVDTASAPVGNGSGGTTSTMTNGNVSTSAGAGGGGRSITVNYGDGSSKIMVPPTATIVRFVPADASAAKTGGDVFIKADDSGGHPTAQFVAVGKGIAPPM